jgi:putative Mg2+ transporter-C (MgtC) family protein
MTGPSEIELIGRVGIAALCGAAVGLEREFSEKPAGLRTHALVAMGAAAFTVSGYAALSMVTTGSGVGTDPSRVAAQVVSGIGFLGAGMVLKNGDTLRGLTTAAEIWAVAALGVLSGLGYEWIALGVTAMMMVVVVGGRPIESLVDRIRIRRQGNEEFEREIYGERGPFDAEDGEERLVAAHRHREN